MPAARNLATARAGETLPDATSGRAAEAVSHNLVGQRLGRKGRDTRERILAATAELLDGGDIKAVTLSAVARRASLGMSSLYNYFTDLTELLLALLEPVMESAETDYLGVLRQRWDDAEMAGRSLEFVRGYHRFWARNSRLLHWRNALADQQDRRMMAHRVQSTQPVIDLLVRQMDDVGAVPGTPATAMATMAMIGIERSITIATDRGLPALMGWEDFTRDEERFLRPGARLLELAIRDLRAQQRG